MNSNTGLDFISQTEDGYVFTVPKFLRHLTEQQTITHKTLPETLGERNALVSRFNAENPVILEAMPDLTDVLHTVRFGALGDTHFCSNYERVDGVHAIYEVFKAEGIETVYHTGNYLDGQKFPNDIHVWGMQNQIDYFIENWPKVSGLTTKFVAGDDHEGWYDKELGTEVGLYTQQSAQMSGRRDLIYLGYMEADDYIFLPENKNIHIKVLHPGGGSAKQISLKSQQIVESWDDESPEIVLVGHYHKSHFLPAYRDSFIFQTGTLMEQSPFMRKKLLKAQLGGWLIEVKVLRSGLLRVQGEWLPVPQRKWKYARSQDTR